MVQRLGNRARRAPALENGLQISKGGRITPEVIAAAEPRQALIERYLARSPRATFHLFATLSGLGMLWAWIVSDYRYIQAEAGIGYALGITGASMMTALLLYPLRKRLRGMSGWFSLQGWFRLHMLLGVAGPACILLHCNFNLGSTNSTVALVSMLLVAGSGLVGRYLYGKFHYGLYGQQVELAQLKGDLDTFYQQGGAEGFDSSEAKARFEALYLACCHVIDSQQQQVSLKQLFKQRQWLRRQRKGLLAQSNSISPELETHYQALAGLLDKLAGLRLFERLFALWHVVHLPVFALMVVTACVHIVVVHWY